YETAVRPVAHQPGAQSAQQDYAANEERPSAPENPGSSGGELSGGVGTGRGRLRRGILGHFILNETVSFHYSGTPSRDNPGFWRCVTIKERYGLVLLMLGNEVVSL